MRSIVGIAVRDERPLAGRIVGWMFLIGAIVTTLLPLLPGADGKVLTPTFPIGLAAGFGGLYAAVRMDWRETPGWVVHAATIAGAACAAIATHDTGGANSPARFLLMLVLVYAAYFFNPREAWPYLGLVVAVHALPLAYDPDTHQLVGELLILAPCYWVLALLLIHGKHGMVSAQAQRFMARLSRRFTGRARSTRVRPVVVPEWHDRIGAPRRRAHRRLGSAVAVTRRHVQAPRDAFDSPCRSRVDGDLRGLRPGPVAIDRVLSPAKAADR